MTCYTYNMYIYIPYHGKICLYDMIQYVCLVRDAGYLPGSALPLYRMILCTGTFWRKEIARAFHRKEIDKYYFQRV